MRYLLLAIAAVFAFSSVADAAKLTRGYIKKNGTYVSPSYRTKSDSSKFNNFSTKGNVNPYTGKKGYKSPYKF